MSVVLLLVPGRVYQLLNLTQIFGLPNYLKKHYTLLLLHVKYVIPVIIKKYFTSKE